MFFGVVPVREAAGGILAHTTGAGAARFKKGRLLSAEDTAALEAAGLSQVHIARLDADDMPEDEAARRIAEASAGPQARAAAAFTGRANLYAEAAGLARIDISRVHALNEIDEALTIATVDDYEPVEPGQMLATVKIIPFAVPRAAVERGEALLRDAGGALVQVAAYRACQAGLILTRVADTKESVLAKTEQAVALRLAHMGSRIAMIRIVPHEDAAVAAAIAEMKAQGCAPILVFGASATVDRLDMVPAGLVRAGGTVEHFGMPVDPGNLLMLGRHGEVPVIGVPGCARSPKLNGFDWVLQRLCADLPVTKRDIVRMGAGGLLKEIPSRPMPRQAADDAGGRSGVPQTPRRPKIAALILAAGLSRRFGDGHKLLAELDGKPVIRHVVEAALASSARPVLLVTGHQGAAVQRAAGTGDLTVVANPAYAEGLASSLQAGLRALPPGLDGVLVCLGDMPDIGPAVLESLIAAFNPTEGRAICLPVHRGKRGNPTLWGAQFLPDLLRLEGDTGARSLFVPHADWICEVAVDDPGILQDYDTPAMLTQRQKPEL